MQGLRFYLQGWVELLARYRAVWGHAWQRRHEMTPPARTADELAFLPAALALQEAPVSPIPRVTAWLLMSFALLALLWACFGQIDIVATAQGKVVPSDRVKTIQPVETATVKAIHVSEGQPVKAGDLLLELDATEAQADLSQLGHDSENGRLQVARAEAMLQAIRTGKAPTLGGSAQGELANISAARLLQEQGLLSSEWQEYQSKLAQLSSEIQLRQAQKHASQARIAKLQKSLLLTREREADFARLQKEKYVARHDWITQKQQVMEQEGERASEKASLEEHGAGIIEAQRQMVALTAELSRTWQY